MNKSIEVVRKQKLASYYRCQARKKSILMAELELQFLEDFPTWELDKFRIPEKYRVVLESYYGLGTAKLSLREIGVELGISKQAVQEFRDKGIGRLHKLSENFNFLEQFSNWKQDNSRLPKDCKSILKNRFGVDTVKLSVKEIELKLGIDRKTIHELKNKGIVLLMYWQIVNLNNDLVGTTTLDTENQLVLKQIANKLKISEEGVNFFYWKGLTLSIEYLNDKENLQNTH